jgi:Zn-dependent peptidase ImmA (M78 family)
VPGELLRLVAAEEIRVEYRDMIPPVEAFYFRRFGFPPTIFLDSRLPRNRRHFRCVLAEELGHHFTTAGNRLPQVHMHYRDRLTINKAEYRAQSWAARYLVPLDKLLELQKKEGSEVWMLAEEFDVTEDVMRFRMGLPDLTEAVYRSDGNGRNGLLGNDDRNNIDTAACNICVLDGSTDKKI